MTTAIRICGLGAVGGFGVGLDAFQEALRSGGAPNDVVTVERASGPMVMPIYRANPDSLRDYVSPRKLRRTDRFSRLAALGASMAMLDGGLMEHPDRNRIGVVMASGYGASDTTFVFLDSSFDDGDACVSPTVFSNSVHSAAASNITILHDITGPCLTVSQFEMSVPIALQSACQWLNDDLVDYVLFGACDEFCPVLGYSYAEMFGTPSTQIEPLAFDRQTAIVAEATAFLVLTRREDIPCYARLSSLELGRLASGPLTAPVGVPVLLAASGHRQCGRQYRQALAPDVTRLAYSRVYGSVPIAPALDLVIAALACRQGRLWPDADHAQETPIAAAGLASLAVDAEGAYGLVHLLPEYGA